MTTEIEERLEGFLPADGTLRTEYDCLAYDALSEIRRLRGLLRQAALDYGICDTMMRYGACPGGWSTERCRRFQDELHAVEARFGALGEEFADV